MAIALQALDSLPAIALADLDAHASLQDRVDVKYVVTVDQLDVLVRRLAETHHALEIDGLRAFRYRTTYYDTDDVLTYREHVQQRRRRFKCRKRCYVEGERSVFEVKLKGARGRTVKHAMACADRDDLAPDELAFLEARLLESYDRRLDRPLRPTLTASCRRCTIVAPALGERLTIDLELDFGGPHMRRGMVIVESKSARGDAAGDRALRAMGVRPVQRCSKYLLGMAMTREDLRANDLRPLLRRYFAGA